MVLTACSTGSPSAGDIQTAIANTQAAQPTETPLPPSTNTPLPTQTNTPKPTNTPRPTNTPKPTPSETLTPGMDTTQMVAKNFVASQDDNGLIVEVARILIADKVAEGQDFSKSELFDDKPVVVEFLFRITNNTDKIANLYVDQGSVAINGEPIDLIDYAMEGARFGDDLGGEFLPGVTAIGGVWIGVKRTPWDQVNKIVIKIDAPHDNDFNRLGKDYYFDIDVADWTFEQLPDELK